MSDYHPKGLDHYKKQAEVELKSICAVWSLLAAIFGPLGIVGWQSFTWLKLGYWPSLPVAALGMEKPHAAWIGVQQILIYIYESPLSVFLLVLFSGLALFFSRGGRT
jgi:hypothetical protein